MKTKRTVQKIFSILCVLILLISCCSVLLACSQQTLSRREEKQIKQDLLALMESNNNYRQKLNIPPPTVKEIELRFLGKYNGYTILYLSSLFFVNNSYTQLEMDFDEEMRAIYAKDDLRAFIKRQEIWKIISVERKETSNRRYALWGYKDGEFNLVEYLYIFGYIDYDHLLEIKNNFTHISKDTRKATVKYTEELSKEILQAYINKYEYVRGWEFNKIKPSISHNYMYRLVAIIDNMIVVEINPDRTAPVEITKIAPAGNYNRVQIGEYVFESDYTLQVYRQGEIVDLDQAYTLGWITDCELYDLYKALVVPYRLRWR